MELNQFKNSAIDYVSQGFSITPIVKGTKANFRQSWSKDCINEISKAKQWWNRYPNDNIAIITGDRSKGLLVIDVDNKKGKNGNIAIKEWEKEHGKFPLTRVAKSPNNGKHLYYFTNEPLKSDADIYEGIDIRCNGGVIIAPPTETKDGQYKWLNDLPIAKADDNVINFIKSGNYNKSEKKSPEFKDISFGITAVSGNRNNALTSYVGSLQAQGYSDNTIRKSAYTYNQENLVDEDNVPDPLDKKEVDTILKSILSKPKGTYKLNQTEKSIHNLLMKIKPDYIYKWDDKGNGKLFSEVFMKTFKYVNEAKAWYFYNGKYWVADINGNLASRYAQYLANALQHYSLYLEDGERKDEYKKYVNSLGKTINRDHMLKDAKAHSLISINDLDSNKDLFNCQNGTYNLKNHVFREHQAEDLISKISNVYYDPEANPMLWVNFINSIMEDDTDKILYMRRLLGYSLTASTKEEKAFILYGASTRNGKSTLVETYKHMLSSGSCGYSATAQPETLSKTLRDSRAPSDDIASLRGARFVSISEPPKGMILNSAFLKQLVGGDTIKARGMYEKPFEYKPDFKIIINTNHLPEIYDNTVFSGNKLDVIPFNKHFNEDEQDKELKHKLCKKENISAIFNWCIEGLKDYTAYGLNPPECIRENTKEYAESINKIKQFIEDVLIESDRDSDGAKLYTVYKSWCSENGYVSTSNRTFYQDLRDNGIFIDTGKIRGKKIRNRVKNYVI